MVGKDKGRCDSEPHCHSGTQADGNTAIFKTWLPGEYGGGELRGCIFISISQEKGTSMEECFQEDHMCKARSGAHHLRSCSVGESESRVIFIPRV